MANPKAKRPTNLTPRWLKMVHKPRGRPKGSRNKVVPYQPDPATLARAEEKRLRRNAQERVRQYAKRAQKAAEAEASAAEANEPASSPIDGGTPTPAGGGAVPTFTGESGAKLGVGAPTFIPESGVKPGVGVKSGAKPPKILVESGDEGGVDFGVRMREALARGEGLDKLFGEVPPQEVSRFLRFQLAERAKERSLSDFVRVAWSLIEPRPYRHNWHIEAICDHLEAVNRGEIRALIITIPPRHSKSIITTVFWPAWTWLGQRPNVPISGSRVSFAFSSWNASLSVDHNLMLRKLVSTEFYRAAAGEQFGIDSALDRATEFKLIGGGRATATSVNSNIMGYGFDIRIADDPHDLQTVDSASERGAVIRWYDEVWKSRVEDPKASAEVVIMQRAHQYDLVGHILSSTRAEEFTVLCLPAEYDAGHPYRWPNDPRTIAGELLDGERFGQAGYATISPATAYGRAAQMQQWPQARGAGVFRHAKWEFADEAPKDLGRLVRYWDKAATGGAVGIERDADYTAGCLGGFDRHGRFYIVDMQRGRWASHEVERRIAAVARSDPKGTAIWIEEEGGSSGKDVISYYQRHILRGYAVRGDRATGPPGPRIDPFLSACEGGNVVVVQHNSWWRTFIDECEQYSGTGKEHDDQVISAAGCFKKAAGGGGFSRGVLLGV